jgi:hypothetical protein
VLLYVVIKPPMRFAKPTLRFLEGTQLFYINARVFRSHSQLVVKARILRAKPDRFLVQLICFFAVWHLTS